MENQCLSYTSEPGSAGKLTNKTSTLTQGGYCVIVIDAKKFIARVRLDPESA